MTEQHRRAEEVDTVRWNRIYAFVAIQAVLAIIALWVFSETFR